MLAQNALSVSLSRSPISPARFALIFLHGTEKCLGYVPLGDGRRAAAIAADTLASSFGRDYRESCRMVSIKRANIRTYSQPV